MTTFKPGDRVEYDGNKGTITRRAGFDGMAWYVRWDNGNVGTTWASDLLHEGEDDE